MEKKNTLFVICIMFFVLLTASMAQSATKDEPDGIRYIVKPGDTLSEICQKYLGKKYPENDRQTVYKCLAMNIGITDPDKIYPGEVIYIFCAEDAKPGCKYRVAWQSRITGVTGHGTEWQNNYGTVQSWCEESNRKTPALRHWIEVKNF